ncbi:MAG: hypothetical protein IJD05_02315 [Bacteroidaceae bacterium]|nr:hypothetical protein [Bacteroidaceae bacterium]
MRKLIVNVLTVAMLALTVGTIFSSCKDYDDEMYADLNGQIVDVNSNLSTLIANQAQDLEDLKAALEAAKTDCEAKYNATQASLKNKQDSINALDAKIKALEAESATHATKAELEAAKAELNAKIAGLETVIEDMKTQMATKQQLTDAIAAVNQSIAETNAKFDGEILKANVRMDSIIANMQSNVINVTNTLTTLQTATENLAKADEEIKDSIAKLDEQMEEAQAFFTSEVSTVATTAAAAASKADANAKELEALKEVVNNIKSCTDCEALKERCTKIESKITAIEGEIAAIKTQAEKNLAEAKKYADDAVKAVADELATLKSQFESTVTAFNTKLKDMESAYKAADTKLQTQINDLKKADKALQKQIDENATAIDELTEELSDVKDALNKRISSVVLQGAYSPVVGYFALPTGVKSNILATYYGMPMYDVNFPTASTIRYVDGIVVFDERIMELLGFDDNDGSFPAGVSYPANQPLVADTANAGKLYLTINPNDVDLSETTFKLVNSAGEEAPAVLGEIKKSSDKLTFGYTRAGANNGFYEITANIASDKAQDATIRIKKDDIKDIVNEFKNFSDGISINEVATKFYSVINDIADANAIEATWTDSLGEHSVYSDYGIAAVSVEPLSYNFMKDVNMTSFPGLSRVSNLVNSIIDKVNISIPDFGIGSIKVPEITKIEIKDLSPELLAKFNVTIKDTVEYELDLNLDVPVDDVVIDGDSVAVPGTEVTVPAQTVTVPSKKVDVYFEETDTWGTTTIPAQTVDIPEQKVTVGGQKVWIEGQTVKIPNVKVTYQDVLEIPIEVSYDMRGAVEDLYGEMTGSIKDVNKMLGELEDFMDDINDILSDLKKIEDIETSIVDAKDKIKSELNKYIDKLNNKLCGLVNSINGKMQPTMLVKTTDGFSMLSTIKGKPSVFNSASAVLVPTSFNAEILAPAFKKYVAVSNVIDPATGNNAYDGDATCVSVLKAANSGDLNKVLEGSTREVAFNGQAGYIYEIVYSAVDYDGFISNSKYYVKIQ